MQCCVHRISSNATRSELQSWTPMLFKLTEKGQQEKSRVKSCDVRMFVDMIHIAIRLYLSLSLYRCSSACHPTSRYCSPLIPSHFRMCPFRLCFDESDLPHFEHQGSIFAPSCLFDLLAWYRLSPVRPRLTLKHNDTISFPVLCIALYIVFPRPDKPNYNRTAVSRQDWGLCKI